MSETIKSSACCDATALVGRRRFPSTVGTLFLAVVILSGSALAESAVAKDPKVPADAQLQAEISRQEAANRSETREQDIGSLLAEYQDRLKTDKDDYVTRFYLANFLGIIGRSDDSRVELERVVSKAPGFVPAYYGLAVYYKQRKMNDRAIQELQRALQIDPDHVSSNIMLADFYMKSAGDMAKAEPLLRRVISTRPHSRMARYRLGKLLYDRGYDLEEAGKPADARRLLEEAVTNFEDVMKSTPDAFDVTAGLNYFWLGHAYYHLDRKEDAYNAFRLAVQFLPPSPEKERALRNISALAGELGLDPLWDSIRIEIQRNLDHEDDQPEDDGDTRYRGALTLSNYFRKSLNTEALSLMTEILEKPHRDLQVRVLVARSLGVAGAEGDVQKSIATQLVKTLDNDSSDLVRASAAYGLAELGWRDAIPALVRALDTDNEYLYGEVLSALQTLAGTERPSLAVVADGAVAELFAQRQKVLSSWHQWWENGGQR